MPLIENSEKEEWNYLPYEGEERYLFADINLNDKGRTMILLNSLQTRGCRLWFETDRLASNVTKRALEHLEGSAACLFFLSRKTMDSHECRYYLNQAVLKGIPIITIQMEGIDLTPAVRRQVLEKKPIACFSKASVEEAVSRIMELIQVQACTGAGDELSIRKYKTEKRPILELLQKGNGQAAPEHMEELVNINQNSLRIGRLDENDLIIHDQGISKKHAVIVKENGNLYITDTGSTNKVYINNQMIQPWQKTLLKAGDLIDLCGYIYRFETVEGEEYEG